MTLSARSGQAVAMLDEPTTPRSAELPFHWSERPEWIMAPQQKRSERALAAIVSAATRLFSRDGFEATTMAAIAEAAGVSGTSLYRRFADKGAIFRAIVDAWSRAWTADLDRMWREFDWETRSATDILDRHIDLVISAYSSDPGLLAQVERRSQADEAVCTILAAMDRHAALSLFRMLRTRPGLADLPREQVEISHWMLKSALAGLLLRADYGVWPIGEIRMADLASPMKAACRRTILKSRANGSEAG